MFTTWTHSHRRVIEKQSFLGNAFVFRFDHHAKVFIDNFQLVYKLYLVQTVIDTVIALFGILLFHSSNEIIRWPNFLLVFRDSCIGFLRWNQVCYVKTRW